MLSVIIGPFSFCFRISTTTSITNTLLNPLMNHGSIWKSGIPRFIQEKSLYMTCFLNLTEELRRSLCHSIFRFMGTVWETLLLVSFISISQPWCIFLLWQVLKQNRQKVIRLLWYCGTYLSTAIYFVEKAWKTYLQQNNVHNNLFFLFSSHNS